LRTSSPIIQHVTRDILRSELESSAAFYALLGFDPVPAPPALAGRAVWLERAGAAGSQIHLMFVDEPAIAAGRPPGHVGIVVEDYTDTVDRLIEAGHRVEPRREHWGSPRSYVRDPAGYLVELMAWAPGQRHAGPEQAPSSGEPGE
jgi:catechol 2,3-dioxygenase-like lactoylglutathione lyase family enzyme